MNRLHITLACTCMLAAATLATALIRPEQVRAELSSASHPIPRQRPASTPDRAAHEDLATRQARAREAAFRIESAGAAQQAMADRLAASAMEQLATLHQDLDLTHIQQQRIFSLLVAFSAPADSSLRVNGRTVTRPAHSLEDAILGELDSERARTYQELLMDDTAWWENAIVQLEEGVNLPDHEHPAGANADH